MLKLFLMGLLCLPVVSWGSTFDCADGSQMIINSSLIDSLNINGVSFVNAAGTITIPNCSGSVTVTDSDASLRVVLFPHVSNVYSLHDILIALAVVMLFALGMVFGGAL